MRFSTNDRRNSRDARRGFLAVVAAALAAPGLARADTWPDRPLRLIVPFAAGGGADVVARAVAAPLARLLGQPVIVDNRPGGGGTSGADLVAKAPADGYTLLYTTPGPQITNPYLMPRLPYDPVADLVPVSEVGVVANVLVVHPSLPVKSVQELVAYARAHPGTLNYASAGVGSSSHLAGELFKARAKIDIVHVPYRGTGPALQDLLGGTVSMAIDSLAVYRSLIASGQLRALGVATSQRLEALPGVPAIAETLPGFDAAPVNYISVRSGTPRPVIDRLNREINAALRSPEVLRQFQADGVLPIGSTPEAMHKLIGQESVKWKQVIETSGARLE